MLNILFMICHQNEFAYFSTVALYTAIMALKRKTTKKVKNIKLVIKYPIKTKFMLVSSNYHLIMQI